MGLIEDLVTDLAKDVVVFLIVAFGLMVCAHIAHHDISHAIPAFGFVQCFAAAVVLNLLLLTLIKFLRTVV